MLSAAQQPTEKQQELLAFLTTIATPFHVNMAYPAMKHLARDEWDFHMLFMELFDKEYLKPVGVDDAGEPIPVLYELSDIGKEAAAYKKAD